MIDGLSPEDNNWLDEFFSAPNGVDWKDIKGGGAPDRIADQVRPWIEMLAAGAERKTMVLPFVREGEITGWYASGRADTAGAELRAELDAWFGPSFLSRLDRPTPDARDPMARAIRSWSNAEVYRFSGPDSRTNRQIAERVADYAMVLRLRPPVARETVRPVGSIRADFDRALLAQDERRAASLVTELRGTGRLNEENLRYLDIRLKAGLGRWPQIARDHALVLMMSDLALPPQSLADIVEALYRTYVEDFEASGSLDSVKNAFDQNIEKRYPRLFSSRRGIRLPRVVKAFILHETLQAKPDSAFLRELALLLPREDQFRPLWSAFFREEASASAEITETDAEKAIEDADYDKAFDYLLRLPLTSKSIGRLLLCLTAIGSDEAVRRFVATLDGTDPGLLVQLTEGARARIAALRAVQPVAEDSAPNPESEWIGWAESLSRADYVAMPEADLQSALTNWDVRPFRESEPLSTRFADLIGNANGEAQKTVRRMVPEMFGAFFSAESTTAPAMRPIAHVLFLLIAMDDPLSRSDLDLLAQLLGRLLDSGLSAEDYQALITDLEDVQERVGSLSTLAWSLDNCETLAVGPCPPSAREARLRYFSSILAQAYASFHRLEKQHLVPIEMLARDFGIDPASLDVLRQPLAKAVVGSIEPSLAGKKIGIYTLAQSAGKRAKIALETMYPGCVVELNSDHVCTDPLKSLAKSSDIFVFAWKSSSHQAFYCVKDALDGAEPIYAPGKGTASILAAVAGNLAP